jgi:membrane protein DedA with SNARE-associated domain
MEFLNTLQDLVGTAGGAWPYLAVFGVLLACGLGVPLPEDISLIFGGWLVYTGRAQLPWMMLTGYLGIIAGDSLIFFFGRRIGSKVGSKPGGFFARVVTPERRARVEALFKKHGEKVVMITRFIPGVRAPTYFTAGSVGMPYSHFLFFDSVAALASAPIFVYLGFRFGGELQYLKHQIEKGQPGVIAALVVLVVGAVLFSRWRARREARANAVAAAAAAANPTPPEPQGSAGSDVRSKVG